MHTHPNCVKYPVVQVRPYGLLAYERTEYFTNRPKHHFKSRINTTTGKIKSFENSYTGHLTPYAKKKLKRAIQLMVAIAQPKEAIHFKSGKTFKFKVNFITLTLPAAQEQITDKEIKQKALDPWFKRMKRKFKLNSYVWRAERQKNGNLHFHIITDTYIHYEKIRNDWNDCLAPLGFIDKFESVHGHRNPNSTDVHSIQNIKNLSQYFVKYMSKDERTLEQLLRVPYARKLWHEKIIATEKVKYTRVRTRAELKIEGKVWDCSQNLKNKKNCELVLEGDQLNIWDKVINDPTVRAKHEGAFSIAFLDPTQFKKYIIGSLRERWLEYLAMIRGDAELQSA